MSATVLDGPWDLSPADRLIVEAKRWGSRLRFAAMLLFYRARGRFPRDAAAVDKNAVPCAPGRAASPDRVARIVRAAVRAHDERRYAAVHARLSPETRARLDLVRQLDLPNRLFADWSPAELEACRQRVAVEAPTSYAAIPRPPAVPGSRPMPTCADARSPTRSSIC